jgi:hypothetical protein
VTAARLRQLGRAKHQADRIERMRRGRKSDWFSGARQGCAQNPDDTGREKPKENNAASQPIRVRRKHLIYAQCSGNVRIVGETSRLRPRET